MSAPRGQASALHAAASASVPSAPAAARDSQLPSSRHYDATTPQLQSLPMLPASDQAAPQAPAANAAAAPPAANTPLIADSNGSMAQNVAWAASSRPDTPSSVKSIKQQQLQQDSPQATLERTRSKSIDLERHPSLSLGTTLSKRHLLSQTPEPSICTHILTSAREFIATFPDWKFEKKINTAIKTALPPIKIPVETRKTIKDGETWVGRSSTHWNRAKEGEASFDEFDAGIRLEHSRHEGAYTPDVYAAVEIASWSVHVEGFKDCRVEVFEMYHSIPVLSDRFFTTCVITARQTPTDLIVVQLPFDIHSLPEDLQARSQRRPNDATPTFEFKRSPAAGSYQDDALAKKKKNAKLVEGRYVSVEHVEVSNMSEWGNEDQGRVVWRMATASDAGGKIPPWVTAKSLPGQIANDVPFFLTWLDGRRRKQE